MSSATVHESGSRTGGPRGLTGRRNVVTLGLLGAGVILLGVSRPWGSIEVENLASFGTMEISGSKAAPAGTAVALAVAAASLVLTIAGRVVRFLIPVGVLVAGVALAYSGVQTINEPGGAAADSLRDTLSLGGGNFVEGFTVSTQLNAWGWIYVVGAVLIALAGLLGILGSRSWPVGGRRFERERAKSTTGDAPRESGGWSTSADVWDAQNRGEDLTSDGPGEDDRDGPPR